MKLVQVLLPLFDNEKRPQPRSLFKETADTLMKNFGGLTAHTLAPAKGLWVNDDNEGDHKTSRDDIVIYEVMTDSLDKAWWSQFRVSLEDQFKQESIVIRALTLDLL